MIKSTGGIMKRHIHVIFFLIMPADILIFSLVMYFASGHNLLDLFDCNVSARTLRSNSSASV